jgi:hypothetical protein
MGEKGTSRKRKRFLAAETKQNKAQDDLRSKAKATFTDTRNCARNVNSCERSGRLELD